MNGYGQSKLAAEAFVRDSWRNHCILRSSIIYGPATAAPSAAQVGRALFLQVCESATHRTGALCNHCASSALPRRTLRHHPRRVRPVPETHRLMVGCRRLVRPFVCSGSMTLSRRALLTSSKTSFATQCTFTIS